MKFILYNNICQIITKSVEEDKNIKHFLLQYATSFETVKSRTFTGNSQLAKSTGIITMNTTYEQVETPLYIANNEDDNPLIRTIYTFPRGLFDMMPDDVKNSFNDIIEDCRTNDYNVDIGLSEDDKKYVSTILQPESGFDLREDQVLAIIKTLKVKRGLNQYPTGCLKGDTPIRLIGSDKPVNIEDMYKDKEKYIGKKVYSVSEYDNLKVVAGTITDIKLTKYIDEYICITLSNKRKIECTPEHLIMLSDGTFVRAMYLPNYGNHPSIMTINFDHDKKDLNSYSVKTVSDITIISNTPIPVYDLEIDKYHNFAIQVNPHKGVIVHNSGKTEIMSGIIKILNSYYFNIKILVIEPTDILVQKTAARFRKYLIDAIPYKDSRGSIEHNVIVSHPMALLNDLQVNPKLLECINGVFFDECLEGSSLIHAKRKIDSMYLANSNFSSSEEYIFGEFTIKDVYNDSNITEVLSYNIVENKFEYKKILRKLRNKTDKCFCKLVVLDSSIHERIYLYLTENHKIWANGEYVPLNDLKMHDTVKILSKSRYYISTDATVDEIQWFCREGDYRYNLEVADNHNYFANNILVSNCHHIQSNTWSFLNKCIPNAEYTVGMSALAVYENHKFCNDLKKLSVSEALILGAVGRVLNSVPAKYYFDKGILTLPVVMQIRFNDVIVPSGMNDWHKLRKQFLESVPRMLLVARVADNLLKYGRRSLILVGTKKQAYLIAKLLMSEYHLEHNFGIAFGGDEGRLFDEETYKKVMSRKRKKSDISKLSTDEFSRCLATVQGIADKFDNKEINILIATSVLYEGFDCDNLDAVIMAAGSKAELRILQIVGRALRKSKTGKYAYVIDFSDASNGVLAYHAAQRIKTYETTIEVPRDLVIKDFEIEQFDDMFRKLEDIT